MANFSAAAAAAAPLTLRILWLASVDDYAPAPNTLMFAQSAGALTIGVREAQASGILGAAHVDVEFADCGVDNATSTFEVLKPYLRQDPLKLDVIIGPPYSTGAIPMSFAAQAWKIVTIGWMATSAALADRLQHRNLVRTVPGYNLMALCIKYGMPRTMGWTNVAVLYRTDSAISELLAEALGATLPAAALRACGRNLTFSQFHTILPDVTESQLEAKLLQISQSSRIIFICGLQEPTNLARMKQFYQLIAVANRLGMTGDDYQWISYPNGNVNSSLPPTYLPNTTIADFLQLHNIPITEQQLYSSLKHFIYLYRKLTYKNDREFKERVIDAIAEAPWFMDPKQVRRDLVAMGKLPTGSMASGHLADSVKLYLLSVQYAVDHGLDYRNPYIMYDIFRNTTFEGYSGYFALNKDGERLPDVALHGPVADYDNQPPLLKFEEKGMMRCSLPENMRKDSSDISGLLVLDSPFVWYTSDGQPPPSFPPCGFSNELCRMKSGTLVTIIVISVVAAGLVLGLIIWYIVRRKRRAALLRMEWLIPIDKIQDLHGKTYSSASLLSSAATRPAPSGETIDSRMPYELFSSAGNTLNGDTFSDAGAAFVQHHLALYDGRPVTVKRAAWDGTNLKHFVMTRRDCIVELHAMTQLAHDNISTFIGVCARDDALLFLHSYCAKGSLGYVLNAYGVAHGRQKRNNMDHLTSSPKSTRNTNNSGIMEWFFKQSFFLDIAAGMDYLHASRLSFHGRLHSENVMLDSRWVAKITGFGKWSFGVEHPQEQLVHLDDIGYSLLYTAPEILRDPKVINEWHDNIYALRKADVYSFAIIMSEVIYNMPPYSHLSYTLREVINSLIMRHDDNIPSKEVDVTLMRPLSDKELIRGSLEVNSNNAAQLQEDVTAAEMCRKIMLRCWAEKIDQRPPFKDIHQQLKSQTRGVYGGSSNLVDTIIRKLELHAENLESVVQSRTNELVDEKRRSDILLKRMLPESVAERLKHGQPVDPQLFDSVTVYFSDIVSFTSLASNLAPFQVVDFLNHLFVFVDDIISRYHIYKVETIGDGYMIFSTDFGKQYGVIP